MRVPALIEIVEYEDRWPSQFEKLAAKDIIDIQITIEPPGMSLRGMELEKRVASGTIPMRTNVHLRVENRFNQRYPLLCRDYLRAHSSAADANMWEPGPCA